MYADVYEEKIILDDDSIEWCHPFSDPIKPLGCLD